MDYHYLLAILLLMVILLLVVIYIHIRNLHKRIDCLNKAVNNLHRWCCDLQAIEDKIILNIDNINGHIVKYHNVLNNIHGKLIDVNTGINSVKDRLRTKNLRKAILASQSIDNDELKKSTDNKHNENTKLKTAQK